MPETVEKVFQEDTLFHDQEFIYTNRSRGPNGMYHPIQEVEEIENGAKRYKTLCGHTTTLGSPVSLAEKVENTRHGHDHPSLLTTCTRCRQIFESRTGRKPRVDMEKYGRGENRRVQ